MYVSDSAEGVYTALKDVPGKDSSSTLVENLTAETTYFFKVLSYTDDVEILLVKGELESSGDRYDALEITTLPEGSGNSNVDTTPDQEEEEQPDPVAPEENSDTDSNSGSDTGSDNDSDSGSSGGGAPLAILFALSALLLGRRFPK